MNDEYYNNQPPEVDPWDYNSKQRNVDNDRYYDSNRYGSNSNNFNDTGYGSNYGNSNNYGSNYGNVNNSYDSNFGNVNNNHGSAYDTTQESMFETDYERLKREEEQSVCDHTPSADAASYEDNNYQSMAEDITETAEYKRAKKVLFSANNGSSGQIIGSILVLIIAIVSLIIGQSYWLYGMLGSCIAIVLGSKCKDRYGLSKVLLVISIILGLLGLFWFFPIRFNFV